MLPTIYIIYQRNRSYCLTTTNTVVSGMRIYLFNLIFLIASFGCQKHTSTDKFSFSQSMFIVNGTAVTTPTDLSQHMAFIYNSKSNYICSGTIISHNVILTAAHCLSGSAYDYQIVFSYQPYDVLFNNKVINKEKVRRASDIIKHDDYVNDYNKAPAMNQSDIGLIILDADIPKEFSPANIEFNTQTIKKNLPVIMAGYGASSVTASEIKHKKNKKFKESEKYGQFICDYNMLDQNGKPTCISVEMTGDGILRMTQGQIKYIFQSEFTLDETQTGTCAGDSGGPVFIKKDNQYILVGVTSRGSLLCNGEGIYTSVPDYADWIIEHLP